MVVKYIFPSVRFKAVGRVVRRPFFIRRFNDFEISKMVRNIFALGFTVRFLSAATFFEMDVWS